ncbi:hypothetical protein SG34_007200 [Thalassomonas viridans]|uniref:Uncharacterized protein n=1 Tax=Thalassomonas viridans TaxID=137584 RepID=A0AAE9Z7F5_9GAMM|nr:hypothetical protein [Thalassomonas viridans]WDE06683.1 hypothetical protein SG34_007200 [Thalassomonas viridans]
MRMKILTTEALKRVAGGSGISKGDDPKARATPPQQADTAQTSYFNQQNKAATP